MPGRGETVLQQEKKKRKRRLSFFICTFLMQKERYHRGYPLKQSSLGIFGSLLTTFTGKITNKTALGRASAGAAVIGRHLVPAEQQHPTFFPGEKKKKSKTKQTKKKKKKKDLKNS